MQSKGVRQWLSGAKIVYGKNGCKAAALFILSKTKRRLYGAITISANGTNSGGRNEETKEKICNGGIKTFSIGIMRTDIVNNAEIVSGG